MTVERTADYFKNEFRALGIGDSDLLLVHSNMGTASLAEVYACFHGLIAAVSPNGTVAFPTFNFDFFHGTPFDVKKTPSQMGFLTEIARRDRGAKRILHPIYGFALFGRDAEALSKIKNKSAYSEDSFFGELHRRKGKIININLPIRKAMTFLHYVEEVVGCDYRVMKDFTAPIIHADGSKTTETYQVLVRDLKQGVQTDASLMEERLESLGLVKHRKIGDWETRLVNASEVFEASKRVPIDEPHLLRTTGTL